ncbi:PAS domain-containing protein [Anabaena sphaerica FACHB-251]|uniref:histidine kinase n=1 Tax=Anabaena sphaerica FACHB-251 TaxID=2692883 RepID=A0A927A2X2_9NOST|nr:PAS domain-containing protein [Anabaena sphaerica]MBD2294980.1 PAS domain-containing protein [Anabaena sphaerica FACHB-251]
MTRTYTDYLKLDFIVRNLSSKLSITTALIGFVVLLGWILNLPVLKSVLPGLVTMKVNTALGFFLAGMSLWLWHQHHQRKKHPLKLLSQILAVIVALIGLLTLIQYGFNINLGIDQLLIKESENAVATSSPGRMAPNTAFCFLWLGLALILLRYRLMSRVQTLTLVSFLIALLGFIGYVFRIDSFYHLAPFTGMAVHTSVTFLLLGLGVLLACPEKGWMQEVMSPYLGGVTARNLLPLVIGVPILTSGLFLSAYRTDAIPIEIGFVIRAIVNIVVLSGVVWWNAKYLNTIDQKYRNAQQALQEFNDNLEARVHERTAQLEFANNALTESRRQLSHLINTLPGIVFSRSADNNWSIDSVSDGYLSIIGDYQLELCGTYQDHTFQDFIVPEDVPKIVAAIQTAIDNKIAYQVEYRLITQRGEEKWLWEKGIETSIDGQSPTIQGFITEITSLKQAQKALEESESKFREIAENIHEVFHINSADLSDLLYVSPGYQEIWGKSCESAYQKPDSWSESIHPEDRDRILGACERLIQGKPLEEEYRIIRPKGDIRWISARVFPVYSQFGQILRHVGIAADITARKLTEIALRCSEERYRSLVEATAQITWTTDPTGQFITLQESWEAFTGNTFAEYQGWNWKNSIHPNDQENVGQNWLHSLENRCLYENECRVRNYNGEYKYLWVRAVPVLETDGSIREWVGACTDITSRKQAELEIQQLNEELEERVQQRTAQLTAANKELEAFSYSVSHDLRAPLRGLDGFSKTLLERYKDQLDDKGKHYLTRIRAGTQRMGELIDDLLQLSRVTRSQMQLTDVNLSAIAQEIAHELGEREPQRQVEWLIAPDLIVQGDCQLLRIVMENLLNNAWKFTSKKIQAKIELTSLVSDLGKGDYLTYVVQDNGVGFDQTYVNKLFQAFQRLHSVEEFPGTGIGLATVQRIVRRHGGDVQANGVVGEGAAFYFTLQG